MLLNVEIFLKNLQKQPKLHSDPQLHTQEMLRTILNLSMNSRVNSQHSLNFLFTFFIFKVKQIKNDKIKSYPMGCIDFDFVSGTFY